ncbi:ATP-binding protein [Kitasatospora sp. NPDC048540]|uniref:ATP-binding protein n=1 Tax=unclassified Kitasatospora TaxID=2633591 RepID=UPI0007C6701F
MWRFPAESSEASVPRTRHAVRDRLLAEGMAGERYQELIDDLLLIVSELVGNAVTHAAALSPRVVTELRIGEGRVRVAVEDGHPYRPKAQESDLGRLGGRGLLLVKSITLQAGGVCDVERTEEGGKVIWAALPLPGPAVPPQGRAGVRPGFPDVAMLDAITEAVKDDEDAPAEGETAGRHAWPE